MARGTQVRVGPAGYFRAAFDLLAERGYGALKLSALCRRLGVTTGSFYHHFAGWPGFVDELLAHWEAEQTERILRISRAAPDPWARVRTMKLFAAEMPHAAEAAIRVWSGDDPRVRKIQDRVDELRIGAVAEIIQGVVTDAEVARRLAVLGLSMLVGWQQLRPARPPAELVALLDEFEVTLLRHATATG